MPKPNSITISVSTVEECVELLGIDARTWTRWKKEGTAACFKDGPNDGAPDFVTTLRNYLGLLRDTATPAQTASERTKEAEMRIAERKDAAGAGELVPAIDYETNYTEAVTRICLKVSRDTELKDVAERVISHIQSVELPKLEFSNE